MIKGIHIRVRITADNVVEFDRALQLLREEAVLVGVPEETAGRKELGPITNAALAYIHDTGSPSQNIPARPFLEAGVLQAQDRLAELLERTGRAVLEDADRTVLLRNLHRVGAAARDAVRSKIQAGPFEPLRPRTLAARRRRGRMGTRPLIDTGQLRNSINYVVRERS